MKAFTYTIAMIAALTQTYAENSEAKITDRNVSVVGFVDAGQVVKGSLIMDDGNAKPLKLNNAFINRNGIALTYSGTMNSNLHMNIGVGGLFWKPLPENATVSSKRIQFGPGISEASFQYDFTDALQAKFGFFGYKYNSDAVNLGEYLLRSEAYPSIVRTGGTGGWVWLNSNEYKSMGSRLTWTTLDGALKQDILLYSEFNEAPMFDFSPSYVVTGKIGKALEIGAGFSLHRWLSIKPSVTTQKTDYNTVVEIDNFPVIPGIVDTAKAKYQKSFAGGTLKDIQSQVGTYVDTAGSSLVTQGKDSQGGTYWVVASTGDTLRAKSSDYLTFKAVKVMARASLDLSSILGWESEHSGSFKLFGEAAILGLQNRPFFYEHLKDRIPMMLGANLPTFGFLSLLSLQMEYFQSPYPENSYQQFQNTLPQPALPGGNEGLYNYRRSMGVYTHDDVKWTVFLQKSLFTGLDLYVQAANDHFRTQDASASPSYAPITREKSDWYYLVRFQWSM